jgi:HD-like signal output (HDOD) protein/ActR/RegA family two-component response regulator
VKKVLFVDDDSFVLDALQRLLHNMRHEWDMRFAASGEQALRFMAESPADIVISDMRMPHMNGAELLNLIVARHPKTIRIILSGYADLESILECVAGTHQFVAKPCDGETLRGIIRRSLEMDVWLNNDKLQTLVSQLGTIPSLPSLYFKILKELDSEDVALESIGEIIARDPGMTAKILQLANSAFFGLRRNLASPHEAALQLGLETVKSLVLGLHVFSTFESVKVGNFSAESLWQHSFATAATARKIAELERQDHRIVEDSFTAGLLHDLGRLILLVNLPDQFAEAVALAKDQHLPLVDAERAIFGASHAEVGGYLLGLWGLPISLVEAAVFHHYPGRCTTGVFTPLTAVHAANVIEQPEAPGADRALLPHLDQIYLVELGLWNRVPIWSDAAHKSISNDPHENHTLC